MASVLFLTACVNPKGMTCTKLCNPETRLLQYMYALDWYITNTSFKILVVENSGYDFSSEYKSYIQSGRLEFLAFNGNDYDRSRGKGYGESLIIDYGIQHSRLLKNASPEMSVIKVTGRLICKNISSLYMCHHKNTVYANITKDDWNGDVAESRVVVAPISFWKSIFLPRKENINDVSCCFFEHILYDSIVEWKRNGRYHREFWPTPPIIEGVSGTHGVSIDSVLSFTSILKYQWMYVLHRFFGYRGYANPFYQGQPKRNL